MKTFGKFLIILIFCIFSIFCFIQTPFAKKWIRHELLAFAHERNIKISAGTISGNLPFEWIFNDVEFSYLTETFHLEKIKIRFGLKELFRKKIAITYFKIEGTQPRIFSITGTGHISQLGLTISSFDLISEDFLARFDGNFDKNFQIKSGHCIFTIPHLKSFWKSPFDAEVSGTIQLNDEMAKIQCSTEHLTFDKIPFEKTTLSIHAIRKHDLWKATANIEGGHKEIPLKGNAECSFAPNLNLVTIENCTISSPECKIFSKMEIDLALRSLEGCIVAQCFDLKKICPLFPDSDLQGTFEGRCDFHTSSKSQDMDLSIQSKDFTAFNSKIKQATLTVNLQDIFGDICGELSLTAENSVHKDLSLSQIKINSFFTPHKSPFSIKANGNLQDPLEITVSGNWQKTGHALLFNIQNCSGFVLKQPFSLRDSFAIECNRTRFKTNPFSFELANGYLSSRLDFTPENSLINVKAEGFPINFLQLFRKDIAIEGKSSIDVDLVSVKDNIQGICTCTIEEAKIYSDGEKFHPIKGSIQIHLNHHKAQVHGDLHSKEQQFILFSGSLPIQYRHFPFVISLDENSPLSANLVAEGKLEYLFEFINIGSQRIKGWLSTQLFFSKTLKDPSIQGSLEVQNGKYENYIVGTYLKNIYLKAKANKQSISINSLSATDDAKGKVQATGIVSLFLKDHFPFEINAVLEQCDTVSFDTITGKFSGNLVISGNLLGAIAKGNLKVDEVYFHIPDKLPSALPELPIKFIHFPKHLAHLKKHTSSSPLVLDLELDAPKKVYIEGKGLHAELEGNLHITGTYTDVTADGTLNLLNGEYLFSGKVFTLTEGELIFNDKPTPSAYVSLKGSCDLPGVSVTALLKGPFSSPQLSFQSSPQLSTSALLAQILFNKDISEISAIQTLQLAQTVFSLSNNMAPNIFEKIRKTLGIDRLTLITSENDPGKISLQIGKYLMRGVLLTLSQGAESRNVAVEVELKRGVMLQAEMNENQQGKFSLKWHHHY